MLSSFRLGAAAILAMGALTAGCAGPMSSASYGNGSAQAGSPTQLAYASIYDNDPRFYAPRMYRSKCDDESDATQRAGCYEEEREEQLLYEDSKE